MCMEYKKAGMTRTEQVRKRSGRCCLVAKLCPTLCNPMDCSSQAPLSLGFPRQEYWSRLPFPSPGDLPGPRIEPRGCVLQADSSPSEPSEVNKTG